MTKFTTKYEKWMESGVTGEIRMSELSSILINSVQRWVSRKTKHSLEGELGLIFSADLSVLKVTFQVIGCRESAIKLFCCPLVDRVGEPTYVL